MTIATWGEALLRLSPAAGLRLSQADGVALHVGGSEANVAVGLASLGAAARWLSVIPEGELGEKVLGELRRNGVDTSRVIRVQGRLGLYFFDPGATGRPPVVTYDRAGSAFAQHSSGTFLSGKAATLLAGASMLHVSGIDLALGAEPAVATMALWEAAGVAGLERSFDVNFRRTLASAESWARACEPYLATADVVFVAERDARELFTPGTENLFGALRNLAPRAEVVVTRGGNGAAVLDRGGELVERPSLPVAEIGRIGRGDAFAAGYLWSRSLEPADVGAALERAIAAATYKSSLAGDLPVLDPRAVEALRRGGSEGGLKR